MDGYHVSHDPAKPFTKEPTTGRSLNILDIPGAKGGVARPQKGGAAHPKEIPVGRGISPSRIACPRPSKPYASRQLREADYSVPPMADLTEQLEKTKLYSYNSSPLSMSGSDVSSRSSGSSPSSLSSLSDRSSGSCTCNRYGITRKGERVKIDCGGSRCGYSEDSSSDCSSDSEPEGVKPRYQEIAPKRAVATGRRR
jgi:hypothetical protein